VSYFCEVDAVPSDHFSYHLRQLVKRGLVEKAELFYRLSVAGKTQAIKLSEHSPAYIRQGLVALRVVLSRREHGHESFLIQERTKVPYKGMLAAPGGKVLFGEDVQVAAQRAMQYETGLTCKFYLRGIVHYKDEYQKEIVQDKFFFVLRATALEGVLKTNGRTGKNRWLTLEDLQASSQTHQGLLEIIEVSGGEAFDFREQTFVEKSY
jgi:ADP-ribose pyrophosphatase YjhB (NUDIX family)